MIVEASLHETVLDRVEVGMPCAIEIDALPGQSFTGRVDFVAVGRQTHNARVYYNRTTP